MHARAQSDGNGAAGVGSKAGCKDVCQQYRSPSRRSFSDFLSLALADGVQCFAGACYARAMPCFPPPLARALAIAMSAGTGTGTCCLCARRRTRARGTCDLKDARHVGSHAGPAPYGQIPPQTRSCVCAQACPALVQTDCQTTALSTLIGTLAHFY